MKESFWAAYVIVFGVIVITFMFAIQSITNTDEHNMAVLKETTEAAMYDAFDYYTYRNTGEIKINREKFVENFVSFEPKYGMFLEWIKQLFGESEGKDGKGVLPFSTIFTISTESCRFNNFLAILKRFCIIESHLLWR